MDGRNFARPPADNPLVPSFLHEALLDILREKPGLIAELLRRTHAPALPKHDAIVIDSADLGAVIPRELAADCLLRFERAGRTLLVVVLEVQLAIDPGKLFSWPAYLVGARLRHRCDGLLVVITPDRRVADWARRPIAFGPGAGHLRAHVIGPGEMPAITDPTEAAAAPELAVLSAVAHGHDPDPAKTTAITIVALDAMKLLTDDLCQLYFDYVWAALGSAARKALNMLPQVREFRSTMLRRAARRATKRGLAEGKAVGLAEGKAEGKAVGLALGIIAVLEARRLPIAADQRASILRCSDPALLNGWLVAAVTASSTADVLGREP